jgi:DNA repair protein RadA/Sms
MQYECTACGYKTAKWLGRCPQCREWGTIEESVPAHRTVRTQAKPASQGTGATPITEVDRTLAEARSTHIPEFDRVLGGGLVPGAVVLLAGEPGVGKSTLLLEVGSWTARQGAQVLYVTGEESAAQVRLRAERVDALSETLLLTAETDLGVVLGTIDQVKPSLLIIDSVQTLASADVAGAPGGVAQVREVAAAVIRAAKDHAIPTVLVGHVTKDGSVAGPRLLEHLVDVVCSFEGERHSRLRMLRAVKNRYGPTDEVGCFDMTEKGIESLPDPSGLFLTRTATKAPGSCLTVALEGKRPMLVEVQALTDKSPGTPRRTVSDLDSGRVAMILAVLSPQFRTGELDVFAATVGGMRISEPASDLSVAMATASAIVHKPLYSRLVAIGEISLSGEVRQVPGMGQRLSEAARQGITNAIVAKGSLEGLPVPPEMRVREAEHLLEALEIAGIPLPQVTTEQEE